MTLRSGSTDDVPALVEVEKLCFGTDAWSRSQLADEFATSRIIIVDEDEEGLAGYATVSLAGPDAELLRIAVLPVRRRRGTARRLLAEVWSRATGRGAERMLLEVDADNLPAIGLYRRFGFSDLTIRRGYYRGRDALVMERRG
ncbi:ribosomal-protein-alanine N-acetyltransferase [Aeromicrobium sp. PE09-221]|uniref:ribosomal protein S18-alanine N-acetyltransferase n=1 Tax=Aeromicrobium sp. PE09-221 TaxID=1898043 RepID=UPI000B745F70|nr:ribosomal protein S18-alanine N-acetyltransferase [Aeromicrobium sp. PE09-221]OUZ10406.1 ribosomal-protein-alanine N-acetyltransferase [Aeromicrobium sp. PE09-221]